MPFKESFKYKDRRSNSDSSHSWKSNSIWSENTWLSSWKRRPMWHWDSFISIIIICPSHLRLSRTTRTTSWTTMKFKKLWKITSSKRRRSKSKKCTSSSSKSSRISLWKHQILWLLKKSKSSSWKYNQLSLKLKKKSSQRSQTCSQSSTLKSQDSPKILNRFRNQSISLFFALKTHSLHKHCRCSHKLKFKSKDLLLKLEYRNKVAYKEETRH